MDRGKSAGDFIKNGKTAGSIEIELSQPHGKSVRILRKMKKNEKKSEWFMNDKPTQEQAVAQFVREQNIMLDNLCHFLPQEKVSQDIAVPHTLDLTRTAGDRVRPTGGQAPRDAHQGGGGRRPSRHARSPPGVDQFERRHESKCKKLREQTKSSERTGGKSRKLTSGDPTVQASAGTEEQGGAHREEDQPDTAAKDAHARSKEKLTKLRVELDEKKQRHFEKREELVSLKADMKQAKAISHEHAKKLRGRQRDIETLQMSIIKLETDSKELERKIKGKEKEKEKQEEKISRHTKELMELQQKRATKAEKPPHLDNQLKEHQQKYSKAMQNLKRIEEEGESLKSQRDDAKSGLHRLQLEVESHLGVLDRKRKALKNTRPDIHRAYEWIRENQDRFRDKVFGPLALDINVKNQEHAVTDWLACSLLTALQDYVEMVLGRDMDSFVAQVSQRSPALVAHPAAEPPGSRDPDG
eukprot:766298-Hanusia_phi.AAC.2